MLRDFTTILSEYLYKPGRYFVHENATVYLHGSTEEDYILIRCNVTINTRIIKINTLYQDRRELHFTDVLLQTIRT
jgi:hypothetical protein